MIINDLIDHYNHQQQLGAIEPYGWTITNVPYALVINHDGELQRIVTLGDTSGTRIINEISMPIPPARSTNIAARFGCDNAQYMLGDPYKGNAKRAHHSFEATRELYHAVLDDINDDRNPSISSMLAFVDHEAQWERARELMGDEWPSMVIRNFTIMVDGVLIIDQPDIADAWTRYITAQAQQDIDETTALPSIIDGQRIAPALTHPKINGLRGGQASGTSLISCNSQSGESYGHSQNSNSPMSQMQANAYTEAINTLLADWQHVQHLDDTSIVTWADADTPAYNDIIQYDVFGNVTGRTTSDKTTPDKDTSDKLTTAMHHATAALAQGMAYDFDGIKLDANKHCSILGLNPQAGRASVALYLRDTMGDFCARIMQHQSDMRIAGLRNGKTPTPYVICRQTVNEKSKNDKSITALRADIITSILNGDLYPTALLRKVQQRIRTEHDINAIKASIIKAYYTRLARMRPDNPITTEPFKEILTMALNEDSTYEPYVLGRMMATYEAIQHAANPNIKATIKDKYFSQAAATPATVFPLMGKLVEKRMRQLERSNPAAAVRLSKRLGSIVSKLPDRYPAKLTLDEQGAFQLGYYQERQAGIEAAIAAKNAKNTTTNN